MRYQLSVLSYKWRNWGSEKLCPVTVRAGLRFKPRQYEPMAHVVSHSEQTIIIPAIRQG